MEVVANELDIERVESVDVKSGPEERAYVLRRRSSSKGSKGSSWSLSSLLCQPRSSITVLSMKMPKIIEGLFKPV